MYQPEPTLVSLFHKICFDEHLQPVGQEHSHFVLWLPGYHTLHGEKKTAKF